MPTPHRVVGRRLDEFKFALKGCHPMAPSLEGAAKRVLIAHSHIFLVEKKAANHG